MPTERFACLATGVGIMLALVFVGADRLAAPWDKVAHFACFALITALLWRGTAGRAPLAVLGALITFIGLDALQELIEPQRKAELLDFVADAIAAAAVTGLLFIRRKTLCAESSEP
jgi:branched-subunit amino acid transport protein